MTRSVIKICKNINTLHIYKYIFNILPYTYVCIYSYIYRDKHIYIHIYMALAYSFSGKTEQS